MQTVGRHISLLVRRSDAAKDRHRVLKLFSQWKEAQQKLPAARPSDKALLLIRLDDIGDYLLFRNQLGMYKQSARWRDHRITLVANQSWKSLFQLLDADTVDATIWVDKNRYLQNAAYRLEIWRELRVGGFETVLACSRTRPLLLDDLCMLAAAPRDSIGHTNTNVHASWNQLSDTLYTSLFKSAGELMHEFQFNGEYARWVCGAQYSGHRPSIDRHFSSPTIGPYLVCFVGASTRSRRWPVKRWIEFIKHYRQFYPSNMFLAGNSRTEIEMVSAIQNRIDVASIAGTVTLPDLLAWVAGAEAVITNDTMAAHMSASLNRPTVIVANGINYMRFSEYTNAGIDGVTTVYPEIFNRRRKRVGDGPYAYSETVTSDIASIRPSTVIGALEALLR